MKQLSTPLFATLTLIASTSTMAQTPASPSAKGGCVELKTVAEIEQTVTAADGSKRQQLVVPAKVVPGDQIVWTTTARNLCDRPAGQVVINQPVPEHMDYIADSALGGGAQITYSIDGKSFKSAADLTVPANDGTARPARADEVRHLRWTFANAIAPQDTTLVRFRASVQ